MDVDAALNELGMLSSVTEIRKQYVAAERNRRRARQISEPSTSTLTVANNVGMTPSNSPDKGNHSGYQVIKLNPHFVTSLSSGLSQLEVTRPPVAHTAVSLGSQYNHDSLEREARNRRMSRMKVSRYHRFKKPYELPWLSQRHSIDVCYSGDSFSNDNSNDSAVSDDKPGCSTPTVNTATNMCLFSTPEKTRPKEKPCSTSNTGSPEKTLNQSAVARSKSLDDLDFSKLRLAEAENHNFILQKKEIDSVSQCMQNLNVNE